MNSCALWMLSLTVFLSTGGVCAEPPSNKAEITLDGALIDANLPRYGLNLGGSGTWGAEHLRANIIGNPGFEPVMDRALLILKEAGRGRMLDDTSWLARPDGFWDGADFEVRSGRLAGASGKVITSVKRQSDSLAEFLTDTKVDDLQSGDVVSLTRKRDLQPAPQWWIGHGHIANTDKTRPGSPGQQALRLIATANEPAEILQYFDNITNRAGKLLLVQGKWKLSFWALAKKPGSHIRFYFGRSGSHPFLENVVVVEGKWKHYTFDFNANDIGIPAVLTLSLTALDGEIIIDDAYLGESSAATGGFRQAVVETLKTLNPGYLRDWQGQLGDTLHNRIAGEFGHQPTRYRPGENEIQFQYGLSDFFELCAAIGTHPWVVAPTTFSDAEWRDFGTYLHHSAEHYKFDEILVEFGNENWNQIFRAGGIPDTATHSEVANRAFRYMKQGSQGDKRIVTVVNSQFVNPDSPRSLGAATQETDRVAVAPYFLNKLEDGLDNTSAYQFAFQDPPELLQQEAATARTQHTRLAVYEVNFHTTWGKAGVEQRNSVVSGAASGPALARRLMQGTLAGVREQCVYLLSGFDSYVAERKDLVRLWGITRDLTIPNNFRPTGLALSMLNRAASGNTRATRCTGGACSALTVLAYAGGSHIALVSERSEPISLNMRMICKSPIVALQLLDGSNPALNNEKEVQVKVQNRQLNCQSGVVAFTLPGYSFGVLTQ